MLQVGGGLVLPGIGRLEPWQGIFIFAGATAIPVLIMLLWLREPPRRHAVDQGWGARFASAGRGLGYLLGNIRHYLPFLVVGALTAVTGYAVTSWSPSLFVRLQGLTTPEASALLGIIGVVTGPLGTIAGGMLLDRLRGRGVIGAPLVIMGCGCLYTLATVTAFVHAPNLPAAIIMFGLFMFGSTFVLPSLYVGMQLLTPDRYRGIAASFNMMCYTLCGLGVGPAAVGAISDRLPASNGSLGAAVVIVELIMAALIVPVALLSRRAFHDRMLAVGEIR
jgi:MFS family permease